MSSTSNPPLTGSTSLQLPGILNYSFLMLGSLETPSLTSYSLTPVFQIIL
jgi:hypothetical protein